MQEAIACMKQIIEQKEPEWIRLRRDIHRHPETGWLEMRTSAIIHERLNSLGYTVLTGRDAVCETARMGVPDAQTLEKHLKDVESAGDAPLDYLTDAPRAHRRDRDPGLRSRARGCAAL